MHFPHNVSFVRIGVCVCVCVCVQDCDIDQETDSDRVDELLELCVKQALPPSDADVDATS